jgi:NAD(P)-dependent dehydrogenase (short-subunit alcohol dehydrogenase family)
MREGIQMEESFDRQFRRTALVTGGTDGIGKQIAMQLARQGVRVLIVGRDRSKGTRAEAELRHRAQQQSIYFLESDLSLIQETERLARRIAGQLRTIDYLVLCADVVLGQHTITSEGVETTFALNYLSRFALVNAMLPLLRAACSTDFTHGSF